MSVPLKMKQKNNILADVEHLLRIKIDLTDFKNKNKYLKKLLGKKLNQIKQLKTAGYIDNLIIF